jgi:replication-associated recombination protein RarA
MNTLFETSPIPTELLLTEKYRPHAISGFLGLEKPKAKLAKLISRPFASAWRFVGPSGMGKTTFALAIAEELGAELHHIPSQKCTVAAVEAVRERCRYAPMFGRGWHLVLIDEADSMSKAARDAFLSILDSTDRPADTIIIFTMNDDSALEPRFLSRCFEVKFSSQGVAEQIAGMLETVWNAESDGTNDAPNFRRIVKDSNNNVRESLMSLQFELM